MEVNNFQNMLTNEDIHKIIEANREVFPTKEDFENLKSRNADKR